MVKDKQFFDFELNVDILTRSRGGCGVAFRMKDPFNFYGIEFNINGGYKRIIKMENGNMTVLKTISDGGINLSLWFKVQVKAIKNTFTIRFGEADKYKKYEEAPVVLEFEDISHVIGQ